MAAVRSRSSACNDWCCAGGASSLCHRRAAPILRSLALKVVGCRAIDRQQLIQRASLHVAPLVAARSVTNRSGGNSVIAQSWCRCWAQEEMRSSPFLVMLPGLHLLAWRIPFEYIHRQIHPQTPDGDRSWMSTSAWILRTSRSRSLQTLRHTFMTSSPRFRSWGLAVGETGSIALGADHWMWER